MARKVYVQVTVRLIIDIDEAVEVGDVIQEVIQEMDYNFTSTTDNTEVVESEIIEHEVTVVK